MKTRTLTVRDALSIAAKDSVSVTIWRRGKEYVANVTPERALERCTKGRLLGSSCTTSKTGVAERVIYILG